MAASGDDNWSNSQFDVLPSEKGSYFDLQLQTSGKVSNNNVVVRCANQLDATMPFFSIPIGGGPAYRPEIRANRLPIK